MQIRPRNPLRQLLSGTGAQVAAHAVTVAISVVTVPLMIGSFGAEIYGDWVVFSAIAAYFTAAELGCGSVAGNKMAALTAQGKSGEATNLVLAVAIAISLVFAAAFTVLGGYLELVGWDSFCQMIGVRQLERNGGSWIFAMLLAQVALAFHTTMLVQIRRFEGRYARAVLTVTGMRFLEFVVLASTILLGWGLVVAVTAMTLARLVGNALFFAFVRRDSPWLVRARSGGLFDGLRDIVKPSVAGTALTLTSLMQNQVPTTLIGAASGSVTAGAFAAMRTIVNVGFQVLNTVNNAIMPEMAHAYGAGRIRRLRYLHRLGASIAMFGGVSFLIFLALFGKTLFIYWTKLALPFSAPVFGLLIANLASMCVWFGSASVPVATNRQGRVAALYFAITAIALTVASILSADYGASGVVACVLASNVVMSGIVVVRSIHLTGDHMSAFVGAVIWFPLHLARRVARNKGKRSP